MEYKIVASGQPWKMESEGAWRAHARLLQEQIDALNSQLDDFSMFEERLLEESSLEIAGGDTEWTTFASVLVVMMTTPGIMLYYGGSVRVENVLATAMQSFALACLISLLWIFMGYSLAFAPVDDSDSGRTHPGVAFFGDMSRFWLVGVQDHQVGSIPEPAFCMFQLTFAIITPALISGAVVDRMKFSSLLVSMGLWHLIVYCPIAHIFWHPKGLMNEMGVLDFAGGNVVHTAAGISALVSAMIIGKRVGFGKRTFHPHNMLVSISGACFLWIGWYGFNAGSALAADASAGIAFLNTQIASSSAGLIWMLMELIYNGQPSIVGLMNGSIAGLVTITPCAGYISPSGSFFVGLIGGIGCFYGVKIKTRFEFDDALDCFGIHAVGGILGNLSVGCFAQESIGGVDGAFYGNGTQLAKQIYGTLLTIGYCAVCTALVFYFIEFTMGLRLSEMEERSGMDRVVHNTNMYSQLALPSNASTLHNNNAGNSTVAVPSLKLRSIGSASPDPEADNASE